MNRARIHSTEYFERRVLFDGMDYILNGRRFVPVSDIDGMMDCHGKGWILYEAKHGDSMPPLGQRILIKRLIDVISLAGVPAIAMVCSHGDGKQVYLKDCVVAAYYTAGLKWRYYQQDYSRQITAKELTDMFLKKMHLK